MLSSTVGCPLDLLGGVRLKLLGRRLAGYLRFESAFLILLAIDGVPSPKFFSHCGLLSLKLLDFRFELEIQFFKTTILLQQ